MRQNKLISFIIFGAVILIFILAAVGMHSLVKDTISENGDSNAKYVTNEEKARKVDPETGKIQLSEEYLKVDYEYYYEREQSGARLFQNVMKIFLLVIIAVSIICVAGHVISTIRKGKTPSILAIIFSLLPIPFALSFMIIPSFIMGSTPKPKDASIQVRTIQVTHRDSKTTTDSDGDSSTSYYIYYQDDSGKEKRMLVSSSMYDCANEPGTYYLAFVREGITNYNFGLYSAEQYEWNGPES